MINKLFVLGAMIGGAYYLGDKTRRDRVFGALGDLRAKLPRLRERTVGASGASDAATTDEWTTTSPTAANRYTAPGGGNRPH